MKTSKLLTILAVILAATGSVCFTISKAAAATTPSVVIVDTGYDPSVTQFANKIVYEQCITSFAPSCPNGKSSQSGTGSAALTPAQIKIAGMGHGSEMLSGEIQTNPNIKFIYFRVFSVYSTNSFGPYDTDLPTILNWVQANASTYNIQAVAMSFERHVTGACPINTPLATATANLKALNIPIFAGAGNDSDFTHIGFPACNTGIIPVGGEINNIHQLWSNAGPGLGWDANSSLLVTSIGNSSVQSIGTSIATQISAASWVAIRQAKPNLTYSQIYNLIQSTGTKSSNQYVSNIPTLNLTNALK
jgi:hypothetical protein